MTPKNDEEPNLPQLDPRLVQWLALQMVQDARARLVEGGAAADAMIELASVFVDLKVTVRGEFDRHGVEDTSVIERVCAERATVGDDDTTAPQMGAALPCSPGDRWLLVGGPGSGKSTATAMIAQLLRRSWVQRQLDVLPVGLKSKVVQFGTSLDALATRLKLKPRRGVLPLRVNLPSLAQWMMSQNVDSPSIVLWGYLAARIREDALAQGLTLDISEGDIESIVGAAEHVLWIFDGLDEVPRTAGRDKVTAVVRAALCCDGPLVRGLLVTTRPQGYEGELDVLATMVLEPMEVERAREYGELLLHAWVGEGADYAARLDVLRRELLRPEIQALVQTPLHATMAALLVAMQGSLPRSRWLLFDHYFTTNFKRELNKPGGHGFRAEDERNIRDLHARVGLVLHVRAQEQAGTRPTLSRRELRDELTVIFRERGYADYDVTENTERMMRFATERLVLLLHARSGEYSFGVRSLQEFFAADALLRGENRQVRQRLGEIALNPHWSNVMALLVSKCALADGGQTQSDLLDYTVGICHALNEGAIGKEAAARCLAGSRLALAMLRETERYGEPWLHDPLWEIALASAESPVQFQVTWRLRAAAHAQNDFGVTPSIWNDNLELHMRLGLVAARWAGSGKVKWRANVIRVAQGLLAGFVKQRLAAWLLLYGLLLEDDLDAIRLADQHQPDGSDEGRRVVATLFGSWIGERVPNWFLHFIETHAAWFTPLWMPRPRMGRANQELLKVLPFEVVYLISSFRHSGHISRELSCFSVHVASLDRPGFLQRWSKLEDRLSAEGPEWEIWRRLAAFHTTPSHLGLAELLDAAADPAGFRELGCALAISAWPVVACVRFVSKPEDLRSLALHAREGDLGTVDDWRAAEARWRTAPDVSDKELQDWLTPGHLPWDQSISVSGAVLVGTNWCSGEFDVTDSKYRELHTRLISRISDEPQNSSRAIEILEFLFVFSSESEVPLGWENVPLEVVRSIEDSHGAESMFCVDQILPNLSGPAADGWFEFLDERGRKGKNLYSGYFSDPSVARRRFTAIADALVLRLCERPDQWGLATALLVMLRLEPNADLSHLPPLDVPMDAPSDSHMAAALLRLLSRSYDDSEFEPLVRRFLSLASGDSQDYNVMIADVLSERACNPEHILAIVVAALGEEPLDESLHDALFGALFARIRRSAKAAFVTLEQWRTHALPGPFLSGQEPERAPQRLVRLVELTNIRAFKETPLVDVPFPIPSGNVGQWIIITGENGIGKTTLLRALALALASPSVASKLLDQRLPMLRNSGDGHVTIEVDSMILDALVCFRERTETVERGPKEIDSPRRPWIVGYGVRRGNARGEPDREPEWGPIGELHTLFDRPASLTNAADWLLKLDGQVLREERQQQQAGETYGATIGGRAAVWDSVVRVLKRLLAVTAVEPEDEHVFVKHPSFGRVRLDALSDGYLTTTGWVIDLIARWIDRKRVLDESVGLDILHQMTGFVLIDEIDLHLHPIWQMRVIDDVRRLFPRLSFIVTTHNPLTLQGSRPGEVYVMWRDGAGVELAQCDIRPGHDVDRVLFDQFGIEHTFDKETRDLLRRHRELLERGTRFDDPTRVEMEDQLAERLGGIGQIVRAERRGASDPLPRLAPEERALFAPFLKKKA